jgi:hypothetical protein
MKILFTLIKFRNLYRVFKSFLSEISTAATVPYSNLLIFIFQFNFLIHNSKPSDAIVLHIYILIAFLLSVTVFTKPILIIGYINFCTILFYEIQCNVKNIEIPDRRYGTSLSSILTITVVCFRFILEI